MDPPEHWPRPAASEEGPGRLTHFQSLALAERLPPPGNDFRTFGGVEQRILQVPKGYERLTLDGKIAYVSQLKMTVADPRIRYKDGRCAAVGPGNSPLGGNDVDKIWIDENLKLTVGGTAVDPASDIAEEYRMIRYEEARFVRQNFPLNRFEGWKPGSQYSADPLEDGNADGKDNGPQGDGKGDGGKGKGQAKELSFESSEESFKAFEDTLTWSQKQAMDLQMDHDLTQVSDQIIRDWWEKKHSNVGLSAPPIDWIRKLYWAQNHGEGPGPGDYDAWGSQLPQPLPQTVEIGNPSSSNPGSDQTGDTTIHHDVGNPNSEDEEAYREAEAREEAIREEMREADEAMRELQRDRQEEANWREEEKAREAIREQIRKADEAMEKEEKIRQEAARKMAKEEAREAIREQIRKADEATKTEGEARQEKARKMAEEEAREEARARQAKVKKMREAEAREEAANQRSRGGKGNDGKGNDRTGRDGKGKDGKGNDGKGEDGKRNDVKGKDGKGKGGGG